MQTGDIGEMMNQFKQEKNATGEGITDAKALAHEAAETMEKAQQTPVEEPKKEETTEQPAPDSSNVQLNSDVNMARSSSKELLDIGTSSETQKLLDEANEVLVESQQPK